MKRTGYTVTPDGQAIPNPEPPPRRNHRKLDSTTIGEWLFLLGMYLSLIGIIAYTIEPMAALVFAVGLPVVIFTQIPRRRRTGRP